MIYIAMAACTLGLIIAILVAGGLIASEIAELAEAYKERNRPGPSLTRNYPAHNTELTR